jgi:hypothetical protein
LSGLPETILAKDLVLETARADSTWDSSTLVILGNVTGGTLISIRDKPKTKILRGRRTQVQGPVHYHIVSDMNASLGTIAISNTVFPSIVSQVRGLGVVYSLPFGPGGSAGQIFILKFLVIVTTSAVANRQLATGGDLVSSKTVAASSTGDLLDRELPCFGTDTFTIVNAQTGDVISFGFVRVL